MCNQLNLKDNKTVSTRKTQQDIVLETKNERFRAEPFIFTLRYKPQDISIAKNKITVKAISSFGNNLENKLFIPHSPFIKVSAVSINYKLYTAPLIKSNIL